MYLPCKNQTIENSVSNNKCGDQHIIFLTTATRTYLIIIARWYLFILWWYNTPIRDYQCDNALMCFVCKFDNNINNYNKSAP